MIRATEVRIIDENKDQIGVKSLADALSLAGEKGLDLVEIAPKAVPPVCRIMDYGKFLYELHKKAQEAKKHQKQIQVKEIKKTPAQQQAEETTRQLRGQISTRIQERNLSAAAKTYLELVGHDSEQILPSQQLLDIANQLAGENRHAESAQAYEQFLTHYKNYEYSEQVQLMLGLLYSRYLAQREPAIKHLQAAAKKLSDPGQLKMCRDELAGLQT